MNSAGAGVVADGGVGGASTSTTRSLVGLEVPLVPFLVSTDRNSSINSHAEGSANKTFVKKLSRWYKTIMSLHYQAFIWVDLTVDQR